jgi:hypothetical protein
VPTLRACETRLKGGRNLTGRDWLDAGAEDRALRRNHSSWRRDVRSAGGDDQGLHGRERRTTRADCVASPHNRRGLYVPVRIPTGRRRACIPTKTSSASRLRQPTISSPSSRKPACWWKSPAADAAGSSGTSHTSPSGETNHQRPSGKRLQANENSFRLPFPPDPAAASPALHAGQCGSVRRSPGFRSLSCPCLPPRLRSRRTGATGFRQTGPRVRFRRAGGRSTSGGGRAQAPQAQHVWQTAADDIKGPPEAREPRGSGSWRPPRCARRTSASDCPPERNRRKGIGSSRHAPARGGTRRACRRRPG